MKLPQLFLVIALSIAAAFAASFYFAQRHQETAVATESAYDRVMRTGVLRCGYGDWPPYAFRKDPTTGEISGILADVTQAVGGKLHLKIEWTENTGWGGFIESLRTRRIDAFCAGSADNAERGRYLAYSMPIFYMPVYAYVRTDEHRFDKDLSGVNSPDVRISVMDGEIGDIIAKRSFPKAAKISIPQLGQITDMLINVADNKADIVFNDPSFVEAFIKENPGKLRRLQDKPFDVFPTVLSVEIHEDALRDMLNSAISELHNEGAIDAIISKYTSDPYDFLRVAKPYTSP